MSTQEILQKKLHIAHETACDLLNQAHIAITPEERARLEYCDYGLGDFDTIGTEILIYINTDRVCAKEMMLTPWQICPQHIHPQLGDYPGKEETFRCRFGEVFLYVPGTETPCPKARIPEKYRKHFTVWHEIHLLPGQQYTLHEKTLHWFQAGSKGAVISEFSTPSFDDADIFTDPGIRRVTHFS